MFIFNLLFILFFSLFTMSDEKAYTIDSYNQELPIWGVSWKPGNGALSHYYPSFYTGFAPRSQYPERIHIRTSRGNQTRVSVILDENSIVDYLYDLEARYDFYNLMTSPLGEKSAAVNISPKNASIEPNLQRFKNVVDSTAYGIRGIVEQGREQGDRNEDFYQKSLDLIKALNPGRVFEINLDLNQEFNRWETVLNKITGDKNPTDVFSQNSQATVIAMNTVVWGRVNYTNKPSEEVVKMIQQAAAAVQTGNSARVKELGIELFKELTGDKYQIKVLGENGQWRNALECAADGCSLKYPEFSAIYPTGSFKGRVKDGMGNRIPQFATPGLWPFLVRSYHEVDHIRRQSYYGFAPKMDYEAIGNGFHNPAVRFSGGALNSVREVLDIPQSHSNLWAVKRGAVSNGCLRLPLGHVWEMRHIMPVESDKMTQIFQFGNNSGDFDLYDINGDGQLEIMGVNYMISYGLKGPSGLDKREGKDLEVTMDQKNNFFNGLYGKKGVFEQVEDQYMFLNPSISFPSHLDFKVKKTKTSLKMDGNFLLYEQDYEQDKVQFYQPKFSSGLTSVANHGPVSKRIVRIMGRVKGCSPNSDVQTCGAEAFTSELEGIINEID